MATLRVWPGNHLIRTTLILVAGGPNSPGQNGPETSQLPDKSAYSLLHPTPSELMREMSADRPDKTDCPFTVDAGHVQIELDLANLGYDARNSETGKVTSENLQIAPMNLKVGLLNNVDFQLVLTPYQWRRVRDEKTSVTQKNSGFGDIIPRVKVNVVGNDGGFFALALMPFVKLPTNQDHLGNSSVEGGLGIPYALDIRNWDVGFQSTFNLNRDQTGRGYQAEFANSVSVGHAVVGKLSLSAEFFSSVSTQQNSEWIGTFDAWLTYQVNKNFRLDSGVYIGVTSAADDWHPWLGMTWRY